MVDVSHSPIAPEPVPPTMTPARPRIDTSAYTLSLTGGDGFRNWAEIFGNDQPVELEVGSGKGLFLANAATARPDRNFVGIELAKKYAAKAAERVAKRRLTNVRVLPGDAKSFLAQHVGPASLAAVHVYFPDPWWKTRHKKRRVFDASLLADVARTVVPEGDLWIATDVEEYFGVMTALVAADPNFAPLPWPELKDPEHDLDYLTNFERKYRIEGRPIYRTRYRRL
jgi:tRNA (guanine-N7-)-methyltransferase